MNVFAGGPQINEKFNESLEKKDPLKDSNGEKIKLDGGGLYPKFKKPENKEEINTKTIRPEKIPQYEKTGEENINIPEELIPEDISEYASPEEQDTDNWPEKDDYNFEGESEIFKDNSKYEHILKRLETSGQISPETYAVAMGLNLEKVDINSTDFHTDKGNEEKNIIEGYINNTNEKLGNKNQNFTEFTQDIKEIKKLPKMDKYDFEIENNAFDSEVLNMIGKNYLKYPEKDNSFNIKEDFSTAILTTKNQIETEFTNFSRETESYKVAINNINSRDITKQMEGINSLYILAASKAGELGKTTIDKYKNSKKEKLIEEFQKLNKEFDELETKTTTEEINKRKKEINERITEIGYEANEVEVGDIFKSGDKEKIQSNIENISENN